MTAAQPRLDEHREPIQRLLRQTPHLGSARVIGAEPRACEVELPDGSRVRAALALSTPYAPAVGDTLLVIGNDDGAYVIGVIEGKGATSMSLPGDVHLHARGGSLTLSADEGVRVRGPELDVSVERFAVAAANAVQKVSTLYQRVREVLTTHARESHQIVEETALSRAKKVAILAEETASVNGKQILLG